MTYRQTERQTDRMTDTEEQQRQNAMYQCKMYQQIDQHIQIDTVETQTDKERE